MNFDLSDEQKMLQSVLRKFVNNEIRGTYARNLDNDPEKYPDEVMWNKLTDLGIWASAIPEEYGGTGGSIIDDVIIVEELSRGSSVFGIVLTAVVGLGARTIIFNGSKEQKQYFLPKVAEGKMKFAFALTEPGGGTDVLGALKTSAVPTNGGYVINGQKVFISGAHKADYLITVAKTDFATEKKAKSLTVFIIDAKSKGITIRKLDKFSMKGISACEIFFEDVFVPKEAILGEINNGWYHILKSLNHERIVVAALSNGIGMAALEDAVDYAKERQAFGRPIGQFQAIQHKIADSLTELELSRLITYKAAWLLENGLPCNVEATMAKMVSSEMATKVSARGLDILAGYGVMMEYDMQRYFRDARQATFAPISNEMVRNYLAESLGLPKSY